MKIDLNRIITIDYLIAQKRTGSPDELAKYLNISRRALFHSLNFMRDELNAPIVYNKIKRTYMYNETGVFCFMFQKDTRGIIKQAILQSIKGCSILLLVFNFTFIEVIDLI